MNISPAIQKLIFSVLIISALGYVAYSTLFGEVELPQGEDGLPIIEVVGQDILTLADKLETVTIEKSLFSSPLFISLVDISTELLPEEQGRVNPFIKVGSTSSGNTSRRP